MGLLDIVWWLVIGVVVGAIARFLLPGRDPMGCIATSLLGVAGAVVGGFLSRLIFGTPAGAKYAWPGFIAALVGALVVLAIVRLVRKK